MQNRDMYDLTICIPSLLKFVWEVDRIFLIYKVFFFSSVAEPFHFRLPGPYNGTDPDLDIKKNNKNH